MYYIAVPSSAVIRAVELTRHFGDVVALDRLDLGVGAGEVACLCGPNGAGKSTTLRLLAGLLRPTSGDAVIAGASAATNPAQIRRTVSLVPEQVRLYPYLTGLENLAYLAALAGCSATQRQQLNALAGVGLTARDVDRAAAGYSKGMRQRVVLALARLRRCPVLLLDEPTSGLDPLAVEDLVSLVDGERARGAAIVIVTHDLRLAQRVGDRVGVISGGRLRTLLGPTEVESLESAFFASTRPAGDAAGAPPNQTRN